MDWITVLGLAAATFTTGAFVPQVWKVWKTKQARDISWIMVLVMFVGITLWLVYGLILKNPPLIFANTITDVLVIILLALKWKYGR